jgi:hypothetical protein
MSKNLTPPDYIQVSATHWARSDKATVALWRSALLVAGDPAPRGLGNHARSQLKTAVQIVRLADAQRLADDAIAFDALGLSKARDERDRTFTLSLPGYARTIVLTLPERIRTRGGKKRGWARSEQATVAQWRKALAVAKRPVAPEDRDDMGTQQYAAAKIVRLAEREGMAEDAVPFVALGLDKVESEVEAL